MTGATRFVCTRPRRGRLRVRRRRGGARRPRGGAGPARHAALRRRPPELAAGRHASRDPGGLGSTPSLPAARRPGLGLPALPSITALARSLPAKLPRSRCAGTPSLGSGRRSPSRWGPHDTGDRASRASPPSGLMWALVVLAVVGWALVTFAARLSEFAAAACMTSRRGNVRLTASAPASPPRAAPSA